MTTTLTVEQILALAPDTASAKAGQGLASARKWQNLGHSPRAAWGECQGSGSQPYRTQIDLSEPAFRCSCPSRKFPCKHGIGLLLLLTQQPAAFTAGEPPPWVDEWLAKRSQASEQRAAKQAAAPDEAAQQRRASQQSRAAAAREAKVAAGVDELSRWLRDQVRQGLAAAQGRHRSAWETTAARLVDAQAPGLARLVRAMAGLTASGEGWQHRLLERLATLHLLTSGYRQLDALPAAVQADLRTAVGWSQSQDELLALPGERDRWLVLGQRVEEEEALRVQRTWLWGESSDRPALLLAFAAANQPLDRSLATGVALDAELVFYPSAAPLRALIKARHAPPVPLTSMPGTPQIASATASYAAALARSPWLERFPLALPSVTPLRSGEGWAVRDAHGHVLPLAPAFSGGWLLLALSGGQPLGLFGEWDGTSLLPLGVCADGVYRPLRADSD